MGVGFLRDAPSCVSSAASFSSTLLTCPPLLPPQSLDELDDDDAGEKERREEEELVQANTFQNEAMTADPNTGHLLVRAALPLHFLCLHPQSLCVSSSHLFKAKRTKMLLKRFTGGFRSKLTSSPL